MHYTRAYSTIVLTARYFVSEISTVVDTIAGIVGQYTAGVHTGEQVITTCCEYYDTKHSNGYQVIIRWYENANCKVTWSVLGEELIDVNTTYNNQVYSQPNAEYKLNNTTGKKNDKKKKLNPMSSWLNTIHNRPMP